MKMVYLTAWLLVCTLPFVSLTLQYHGVEVRTVCGVERSSISSGSSGRDMAWAAREQPTAKQYIYMMVPRAVRESDEKWSADHQKVVWGLVKKL